MTYSLSYLYGNWWLPLIVSVVIAFILTGICYFLLKDIDEFGKKIKPEKPRKLTRNEILINIFVGIIMVCLIIGICLLVLSQLSNDVTINCANCTVALNG